MPLPLPLTALELIYQVLSRLDQDVNSATANLDPGTGGSATIATTDQALQYINEASADLARGGYPIQDSGTYVTPTTTLKIPFSALTMTFGAQVASTGLVHTLWAPRRVKWNTTWLDHITLSDLEQWYSTTYPDDTGTPKYWTENGTDGIILYPTPSSQQTTTVYGFCTPRPLVNYQLAITGMTGNAVNPTVITTATHNLVTGMQVYIASAAGNTAANGYNTVTRVSATTFSVPVAGNGTWTSGGTVADVPNWFTPDRTKMLEWGAASMYARKNLGNDPSLGPLTPEWERVWEQYKSALFAAFAQQDSSAAKYHFPLMFAALNAPGQ